MWRVNLLVLLIFLPGGAHGFDPWVDSARYELRYQIDLGKLIARAGGGTLRLWIPLPLESAAQQVISREIDSAVPYRTTRDFHGNRYLYVDGNESAVRVLRAGKLSLRFVVERRPDAGVPKQEVHRGTRLAPALYMRAQRRIPLDGVVREIARRESQGIEGDAKKIRAFYDYVVDTMRYSKEGEGWGHGDAIWACNAKYGNCTDFHSLFLGLARSQGIAARFVIGFPVPSRQAHGRLTAYHCWAQAFDPARGWLPLDASEAKKSGRREDYFGRLPSDRIAFSVGRDLELVPPQQGERLNYLVYPYAEVDGKPVRSVPWDLRFDRLARGGARRSALATAAQSRYLPEEKQVSKEVIR